MKTCCEKAFSSVEWKNKRVLVKAKENSAWNKLNWWHKSVVEQANLNVNANATIDSMRKKSSRKTVQNGL